MDLDLHGVPPDRGRVAFLIAERWREAARAHAALRIVHGKGEGVMARLVADILHEHGIAAEPGWLNSGATIIPAKTVQRLVL